MLALLRTLSRFHFMLVLLAALQLGYWYKTKDIKPTLDVVPPVPGRAAIHAMTFGDDQFYFRTLAFNIQNFGDSFGRFTPLRDYDFNKLYLWFVLLDDLDKNSNFIPTLACYYFSQTQNAGDVRFIVDYLYNHSKENIKQKWWWLVQAIYISMHKLHDNDLAVKVAQPLVNDDVPVWAQQMAAVVYEKRGEFDAALSIMETIKANAKHIDEKDLKYMEYFVKERIKRLDVLSEFKNNKHEE